MRIDKLILKNFRIYRGCYSFDFEGKDLIVVQGQNGNGKSCLFDAIEWCLTGDVSRYKGSREEQKFNYIMHQNAFENLDEMFVQLEIGGNTVKRRLCPRGNLYNKEIYINGTKCGSQAIGNNSIREILCMDGEDELLSNSSMFKGHFSSTQILSQDKLTDFVHYTIPQERFNVMENILGLRRYGVDFRRHISLVIKEKGLELENLRSELDNLNDQNKELETMLKVANAQYEAKREQITSEGFRNKKEIIADFISILNTNDYNVATKDTINLEYFADIRKQMENRVQEYKNKIFILNREYSNINIPIKDILASIEVNRTDTLEFNNKLNKVKSNIKIAQDQIEFLKKLSVYSDEYQKKYAEHSVLMTTKEKMKGRIRGTSDSIVSVIGNRYKEVESFTKDYNQNIQRLKAIADGKKIFENRRLIDLNEVKIIEFNKTLTAYEKQLELHDSHLKNMQTLLTELERNSSRTIVEKNIELIEEVQRLICENNDTNSCLVCGSKFIDNSELQDEIKKQGILLKESIDFNTQRIIRTSINIKETKSICEDLNYKINDYSNRISELHKECSRLRSENIVLQSNISSEYSESLEKLISEESTVLNFIDTFKDIYGASNLLLKDVDRFNEVIKSIKDVEGYMIELNQKAGIENNIKDSNEIYENIEKSKLRLHELRNESEFITSQLESLKNEYSKNELKKISYEKSVDLIKEVIGDFDGNISSFVKNIERLRLIENKMSKDINRINGLIKEFNSNLTLNNLEEIETRLSNLRRDHKMVNERINHKKEKERSYEMLISEYQNVITKSQNIHSDLMNDFMIKYNTIINSIYSQITPHNYNKYINLVVRNGELYLILDEEKRNADYYDSYNDVSLVKLSNASLTLSSAQSSILAVCIFISMNMSQNWTKLNFIGIDDPFQNMDDINVFSFIDVISNVLGKKQTMISSHNIKFANLISTKSELDESKICTIHLKSYSKNKVKVISECVTFLE